jgi:hypothetical protein
MGYNSDVGMGRGILLQDRQAVIRGTIIDTDNLKVRIIQVTRKYTVQATLEIAPDIVTG